MSYVYYFSVHEYSVYSLSVARATALLYTRDMSLTARECLAKRVRELRAERGWSQDKLAAAAGLHRTYIGPVERAEHSITVDSVEKLAQAFRVPIAEMFRE